MASVNSIYSSSSRITAMFSDLDTDSLVKSLCSTQQTKVDNQYRKKQLTEWKSSALTDISDAVKTFSNNYCSVLGSNSMLKSSTYTQYSVTTADTSGAVSIDADGSAFEGSLSISVEQIAGSAKASGTTGISTGTELSSSNTATLDSLAFDTKLQFNSNDEISFSINGKAFTFGKDTTLQGMINAVNADSDAGVTMKYSRLTDSFTILSDKSGADSELSIQNISGNAFGVGGAFGIAEGTTTEGAQNAIATIDGVRVEREDNSFEIDGLTYNLKDTTTGSIKFNVERDFSSTVDAVKEFVKGINDLITTVKGYTDAKDYSKDYKPLLDSEKEEMTEKQVELWESKAKSGILKNDGALEELVTNLKSAFFSDVGGTGLNLASIGITTGSYFGENAGLLEVDEDALKAALAKDSDSVISMFTGGNSTASKANQGAVYQVKSYLNAYLNTSGDTIDTLGNQNDSIEDEIDEMEDRLANLADKYYNKFAAMETALSQLNSTASYLSSMFSA